MSNPVPGKRWLILVGAVCFFFSIIMIGIDGSVYATFSNVKIGAWWIIVPVILAISFGAGAQNRSMVIAASVFSVLGVILGIIGSTIDGASSKAINMYKLCGNVGTGSTWGPHRTTEYKDKFMACAAEYTTHHCICVDTSSKCYFYDGDVKMCPHITNTFHNKLAAGAAFDAIVTVCIFIFCVLTCISCCCPASFQEEETDNQLVTTTALVNGGGNMMAAVTVDGKDVMVVLPSTSKEPGGTYAQYPGAVYCGGDGTAAPAAVPIGGGFGNPAHAYGGGSSSSILVYGQQAPAPQAGGGGVVYGNVPPPPSQAGGGIVYGQQQPQSQAGGIMYGGQQQPSQGVLYGQAQQQQQQIGVVSNAYTLDLAPANLGN